MNIDTYFQHRQHAHCESGVTSNLLRHHHINLSEPMAFGIGGGIFFAHLPFVKVSGVPATTFRTWPGTIFKKVATALELKVKRQKFRHPAAAMAALDSALEQGIPVGMIGSVFYLPYLPEAFRFHFNAHNFVVYGKRDGMYLVSDPVLEETTTIAPEDLIKARFAKGTPEPSGYMYYLEKGTVGNQTDMVQAVRKGIRHSCFMMQSPPLPWFGQKAIKTLAKKIAQYPDKLEGRRASLYLGNIIRMQEEIGTGGGGFRYMYAAFLQEAAQQLGRQDLASLSQRFTQLGDSWRHFAYLAARQVKNRKSDLLSYKDISEVLLKIADEESQAFKALSEIRW